MRKGNFSRNKRNDGRNRNSNNRGRGGRRNYRRNNQEASISGNQRERISVESGYLVLIDQFMLANPQFVDKLMTVIDEDASVKDKLIEDYGGTVVELEPGTYRIHRDPFICTILIHPEDVKPEADQMIEAATGEKGNVFVDTRCVAMIDRELLDDSSLIEKYQQLWFTGQDKACRDLLRDNGGAVRYGFRSLGDDLKVNMIPDEDTVCIRPATEQNQDAA